jgi:hypothetical protein
MVTVFVLCIKLLSDIMLMAVILLRVVMPSVILTSAIILSVAAPCLATVLYPCLFRFVPTKNFIVLKLRRLIQSLYSICHQRPVL